MATNIPETAQAHAATLQLRSLFDSLPALISQVRANKVAAQTVVQLRMIIPRHRKQASEYLMSKGHPDPFINLPESLDPNIPLPPHLAAVQNEVQKNLANATPNRSNTSTPVPRPQPIKQASPPLAKLPVSSQVNNTDAMSIASQPSRIVLSNELESKQSMEPGKTSLNTANTQTPMVKRPPAMAPGGKYTWAEVFIMSEAERQKWFLEIPEAQEAYLKIYVHAQRSREQGGTKVGSGTSSPAAGSLQASSGRNNGIALDILAKNPPPLPNLNLPPHRTAITDKIKIPPSNNNNPYAFLTTIKPAPPHLDVQALTKSTVDTYLSVTDDQAKGLTPDQREVRVWIRQHVSARRARQQEEEQRRLQRIGQGQYGMSFKVPHAPGLGVPGAKMTVQSLAQEVQRYKEREGKPISLEAVKEICRKTGTAWTPEIEKAVQPHCAIPIPSKTSKDVMEDQIRRLAVDCNGEEMPKDLFISLRGPFREYPMGFMLGRPNEKQK